MTDTAIAPRFPVLDSLRAVGAVAVLTTHVAFYSGDYTRHGTWGAFLARLDVGVAIFFVLSGFLLSRPYIARATLQLRRPATGHYLWKRLLRIFPVYAVAVVLALALHEENDGLGIRDWLVTLTLANTFVDPWPPSGLSQMWSLAVEATFYLLLPLLMLLAIGRRGVRAGRVWAAVVAMIAISTWWHLDGAARSDFLTDGQPLLWLPTYLGWFAVGIGLAHAHVLQTAGRPSRLASAVLALGRQPGVCWALAAALMLVATTPLAGPVLLAPMSPAESLTKNLLYAAIGGLLVLSGVAAVPGSGYARLLGSRPARHLGLTSYSLFCLHLLLLDLIAPALGFPLFGGNGLALWAVTLAASLLAAEVAYRVVERPAMRLKGRFPLRRGSDRAKAASGTTTR